MEGSLEMLIMEGSLEMLIMEGSLEMLYHQYKKGLDLKST
jgi:hypothetical protein